MVELTGVVFILNEIKLDKTKFSVRSPNRKGFLMISNYILI